MNKKILASLLVTPLAFNAMGAIPVSEMQPGSWDVTGIPGSQLKITDNSIACPVGSGVLTQTIKDMPQGTYNLTFNTLVNAKVTINGQLQHSRDQITIELAQKGDITITIEALDPTQGFSFACSPLELDFDFEGCEETLSKNLGEVGDLASVVAEAPEAENLNAQKDALQERIEAISAEIGEVAPGTIPNYEKYKLYDDPNAIQEEINALAADVQSYNEAVAKANQAYDNFTQNTAAKDAFNKTIHDYTYLIANGIEKKLNEITDADEQAYVRGEIDAEYTKYKDGIEKVQELVDQVYAEDRMNEDPAVLKAEITKLLNENDVLSLWPLYHSIMSGINIAKADYEAYQAYLPLAEQIKRSYDQTLTLLGAIDGVTQPESIDEATDYQGVYTDVVDQAMDEVNYIYNALPFIKDIKGAAGELDAFKNQAFGDDDDPMLGGAHGEFQSIVKGLQAMADEQNSTYEAAKAYLGGVDGQSAGLLDLNIRGPQKEAYQEAIDAFKAAEEAYKAWVNDEYTAHKLANVDGCEAAEALDAALATLGYFYPIAQLQTQYDEMVKTITNTTSYDLDGDTIDLTGTVDIVSKFNNDDGTFKSIQAAIDALTPNKDLAMSDGVRNIDKAIDDALTTCGELAEWFAKAKVAVDAVTTAYDFLNGVIDAKWIATDWDKYSFKNTDYYKNLPTEKAAWVAALAAAAADPSQSCWEAAKALQEEINAANYDDQVQAALAAFEEASTSAQNYAHIADKVENAKQLLASEIEKYAYYDVTVDVSATAVDEDMQAIETAMAAAAAETGKTMADGYTDTDNLIKEALDNSVKAFIAQVDLLKANRLAYEALAATLPGINTAIEDLAEYNRTNTLKPAEEFFADAIAGAGENSLKSQSAALAQAMLDALANVWDKDNNAIALTDDLTGRADALNTAINAMREQINTNTAAHNADLAASQGVRDYLQSEDTRMKGLEYAPLIQEYLADLQAISDKLTAVDRNVTDIFAVGECKALDPRYAELLNEAKALLDSDKYQSLKDPVQVANDFTAASWAGILADLNTAADNAVLSYNRYATLTNQSYRDYLNAPNGLPTHVGIYEYWQKIVDLNNTFEAWKSQQNADKHAFTEAEYEAWTNQAYAMGAEIIEAVQEMVNQMNQLGEEWIVKHGNDAQDLMVAFQEKLQEAGVTEPVIEDAMAQATAYFDAAMALYNKAQEAEANEPADWVKATWTELFDFINASYGMAANGITDNLDAIPGTLEADKAAVTQWGLSYADAQKTLEDYKARLDECHNVDPEVLDAQMAIYNQAVADITALNGTPTTIDNLKEKLDALNKNLELAEAAVNAIEQNNAENVANLEKYNEFLGQYLDIADAFDALKEWLAGFAGGAEVNIAPIENAVTVAHQTLLNNQNQAIAQADAIEAALNAATGAINGGYQSGRWSETQVLARLLDVVKVAYNNAKVSTEDGKPVMSPEEVESYRIQINDLEVASAKLGNPALTNEEFKDDAYAQETALCGYIQTLSQLQNQPGYDRDPQQTAIDNLTGAYQLAEDALSQTQEYLLRCLQPVQSEYRPQVTDLMSELELIQPKIENSNINIIAYEPIYAEDIADIQNRAETLLAQIQQAEVEAQAQKAITDANDAAYQSLNDQLDAFQTELNDLKAQIETLGLTDATAGDVNTLQYNIDYSRKRVQAMYDAVKLTAETPLPELFSINKYFNLIKVAVANRTAGAAIDAARHAIQAITFPDNMLADVKAELVKKQDALNVRIQNLDEAWTAAAGKGTVDQYQEMTDKANAIAEEAKAINAEANESENTATPGDVNGDPNGEVDAADVQTILGWIADGVTMNELKPWQQKAADVDGNGELNVADATAIINIVLEGQDNTAKVIARMAGKTAVANGMMQGTLLSEENGVSTFALTLNTAEDLVNGAIDIQLSAGMEIIDVRAGDAAKNHQIVLNDKGNTARVVVANMDNEAVSHEGAVIIVEARGHGNLYINNAEFADGNANAFKVPAPEKTALESIYEAARSAKQTIYNAAGQVMDSIQRGVNIIRHNDGSVTKEKH